MDTINEETIEESMKDDKPDHPEGSTTQTDDNEEFASRSAAIAAHDFFTQDGQPVSEESVELLSEYIQQQQQQQQQQDNTSSQHEPKPTILLFDTQDDGIFHPVPKSWTNFFKQTGQQQPVVPSKGVAADTAANNSNDDDEPRAVDTIPAAPDLKKQQPSLQTVGKNDSEQQHSSLPSVENTVEDEDDDDTFAAATTSKEDGGALAEEEAAVAEDDADTLKTKLDELEYLIPRLQEERKKVLSRLYIVREGLQAGDRVVDKEQDKQEVAAPNVSSERGFSGIASLADDQDDSEIMGGLLDSNVPGAYTKWTQRLELRHVHYRSISSASGEARDEMYDASNASEEFGEARIDTNDDLSYSMDSMDAEIISELLTPRYNHIVLGSAAPGVPLQTSHHHDSEPEFFDAVEDGEYLQLLAPEVKHRAAVVIQSAWRGYLTRRVMWQQQESALMLQSLVRMRRVRKVYKQQLRAIYLLQVAVRSVQARAERPGDLNSQSERDVNQGLSLGKLHKARNLEYMSEERRDIYGNESGDEAKKDDPIDALERMASAEDQVYTAHEQADEAVFPAAGAPWQERQRDEYDLAATRIQNAWRRFRSRRSYMTLIKSFARFQAMVRRKSARDKFERKVLAATLIERLFIAHRASCLRRHERTKAATTVQRFARGYLARLQVARLHRAYYERNATAIQSQARGYVVRRRLKEQSREKRQTVPSETQAPMRDRHARDAFAMESDNDLPAQGLVCVKKGKRARAQSLWRKTVRKLFPGMASSKPSKDRQSTASGSRKTLKKSAAKPQRISRSSGLPTIDEHDLSHSMSESSSSGGRFLIGRNDRLLKSPTGASKPESTTPNSVDAVMIETEDNPDMIPVDPTLEMTEGELHQIAFANQHAMDKDQAIDEYVADVMHIAGTPFAATSKGGSSGKNKDAESDDCSSEEMVVLAESSNEALKEAEISALLEPLEQLHEEFVRAKSK